MFGKRGTAAGLVLLLTMAMIVLGCISGASAQQPRFKVVAIAEKGGIHKPFVDAAKAWLAHEAAADGFTVDYIEDTSKIDDAFLSQYKLFIQLNFPPYAWTPTAMDAFQRYIEEGRGGWIGFHHATDRHDHLRARLHQHVPRPQHTPVLLRLSIPQSHRMQQPHIHPRQPCQLLRIPRIVLAPTPTDALQLPRIRHDHLVPQLAQHLTDPVAIRPRFQRHPADPDCDRRLLLLGSTRRALAPCCLPRSAMLFHGRFLSAPRVRSWGA